MNNGQDQIDHQNSGVAFVRGVFTGAVIGAGLGLLFAPRAGSKLRRQIAHSATNVGKAVRKNYRQASHFVGATMDDLADQGRQMYDQARDVVSHARGEVQHAAEHAARGIKKVSSAGHR